ncbi:MAG: 50S ribosomal protein L13 [Candidatus Pacebacteria bacterium]|nr:50S ribosomal protein L13 [Candidatus Paceibacterota bacterium]
MTTFVPKETEIERKWLLVDAEDQVLGRLAVKIADILRGKTKPQYTPHLDCGDYVIVINAAKVCLTGRKETNKIYQKFTGHMGGQTEMTAAEVRAKDPERMIRNAVWGMLPKGKLGRQQFRKLKVYAGSQHSHEAQQPEEVKL